MIITIPQIIQFWFDECEPQQWFVKDTAFDEMLNDRFGASVELALRGKFSSWAETKEGTLALIILLDQMTRNIYRDTPKAFAGDPIALALSLKATERGDLDSITEQTHRQFLLMPMMHSEDINIQNQSLPLFKKYTNELTYEYAKKHQIIIERFGLFPHRNAILGRRLTKEMSEFLLEADSSF